MAERLVRVSKPRGPGVRDADGNLSYPLTQKTSQQKELIFKDIQKEWRKILRQHFDQEATIIDGKVFRKWARLSDEHLQLKEDYGLSQLILRMNRPSLASRYQNSIKWDTRKNRIWIVFPELIGVPRMTNSHPARAGVHQNREEGNELGRPLRRIGLKDFKVSARKIMIEHLTGKR